MFLISAHSRAYRTDVWHGLPLQARQLARSLQVPDDGPATRFDPASVAGLPEPARRWLTHAIAAGTTLRAAVELRMHGEIRLGGWRSFTASQLLVPDSGFVWAARTRLAGLPITGFDAYAQSRGVMSWRVAGLLPVHSGSDGRIMLSAAGRLAAEAVLVPSVLVDADWRHGPDPDSATYARTFGAHHRREAANVQIAADGQLVGVKMQRWGRPDGEAFGLHRFEVVFDSEYEIAGLRIGDGIHAAWLDTHGRRHEFYRATLDTARFLGTAASP